MMVIMVMVMTVAAKTGAPRPVFELLNDRASEAAGTLALQGRVSYMIIVFKHLLDLAYNFSLSQTIVGEDIDVRR